MMMRRGCFAGMGLVLLFCRPGLSQVRKLDPGRELPNKAAASRFPLPEQFIWTRDDAAALTPDLQARVRGQNDKIAPHYFRRSFQVARVPVAATLYIAGPRAATVYLNGKLVMHVEDEGVAGKGLHVLSEDVHAALKVGKNTLAIEAVRGHSSLHTAASARINQVTYGEVLVVKIVPRMPGVNAPALTISDVNWRSSTSSSGRWFAPEFDDRAWARVQSLGAIGSRSDFLQWNADAGLYAWPGYRGISPFLRTFPVPVVDAEGDSASFRNVSALRSLNRRSLKVSEAFTVLGSTAATEGRPPTLLLDFGRELSGRVRFNSVAGRSVSVDVSYGESREEAMGHPYLGVKRVLVPPHGVAYGPKSAFRYVQIVFPNVASNVKFRSIEAEAIAYPVRYLGSFASSDSQLNRIWETGAYTAHLCMQDSIWDGVKRDRGRWMGDLDVTGRVINDVFADHRLMESTMRELIGDAPVQRDVNTIAGYSALWITGLADYYRHSGNRAYLQSLHPRLVELLGVMDRELDVDGLFANPEKHKIFVDWSAGFSDDTPEARAATHLELYLAYQDAAYLLGELDDTSNAVRYRGQAARLLAAAHKSLRDATTHTYGTRWQTNAMAIVSNAAGPDDYAAIWSRVLSEVDNMSPDTPVITPYYGYYVLSAMARTGHRAEALAWMRHVWGGMLDEGATSFWEAYDRRWPKQDFHRYLEADNKKGYYVSLAHGWSSGPTAWLMEEILGIHPTAAGFREVSIRPDLAGLAWAEGGEPTPRGKIAVSIHPGFTRITIPRGTLARVLLPVDGPGHTVLSNGRAVPSSPAEGGTRALIELRQAGRYELRQR